MKVVFKYGIGAMSGTIAEGTHRMSKSKTCGYMRRWVMPAYTAQNQEIGSVGKNLGTVWKAANADYLGDYSTYTTRLKSAQPAGQEFDTCWSPYAWFTHMMYEWQKSDPLHIDLASVTIGDIVTLDGDVRTIARAVAAGFLPNISLSADLSADIQ